MGIKRGIDFRLPDWEYSYRYSGDHTNTVAGVWQTALDLTASKRGTMYLRHVVIGGANYFVYLRVTIDGVADVIRDGSKGYGMAAEWIFDFNKSVKIEHHHANVTARSRVEWAYFNYDKDGSSP